MILKFINQTVIEDLYLKAKYQFMFKTKTCIYYLVPNLKLYSSPYEILANNETKGIPDLIEYPEIEEIFVDGKKMFEKVNDCIVKT